MKPVNLDEDNLVKCKCPECPVQKDSGCVAGLLSEMAGSEGPEMEGVATDKKHLPKPEDSPAVYCSTQVNGTGCDDLNYDRACLCPACDVWQDHDLDYNYFCQNGAAGKIEKS